MGAPVVWQMGELHLFFMGSFLLGYSHKHRHALIRHSALQLADTICTCIEIVNVT